MPCRKDPDAVKQDDLPDFLISWEEILAAVLDFVVTLMDELLNDKESGLNEQDIRFYDKGPFCAAPFDGSSGQRRDRGFLSRRIGTDLPRDRRGILCGVCQYLQLPYPSGQRQTSVKIDAEYLASTNRQLNRRGELLTRKVYRYSSEENALQAV